MPHGNQSESECLLGGKIGKIGKIPGILRVYLEKPGYTRVIPALLHGFAPGTTPTAATTNENPAYHFRIPLYHTTPKLIKISPNTSLIPVKFLHCPYHAESTLSSAQVLSVRVSLNQPAYSKEGANPCTDGRPSETTPVWIASHQSSFATQRGQRISTFD